MIQLLQPRHAHPYNAFIEACDTMVNKHLLFEPSDKFIAMDWLWCLVYSISPFDFLLVI